MANLENTTDLEGIDPAVYHKRWRILATLCTSLLLVVTGNSSLNLALPTLSRELSLTSVQLTWMVDIYSLIFASLLFTMSAVADRYGRKMILQIGLGLFSLTTLYAAFIATSGLEIIIARAIMGFSGAMVMPTTLSIINNVFPRKERARAIAIWSGVAGGGIALGSIITGFLLEHYSWQSVFILSAVIGTIGLIFNQWLTPSSRDEHETPIDWLGGVLSTIGLFGLVYGIIEAPTYGLGHTNIMISLGTGFISLGLFIFWQMRTKHPMLDMRLFKSASFSVSALSITLAFFSLMGVFFSMSQLFQLIIGYGTLESSIRLLPMMMLMVFISPFVPNIVKRIGTRWTISFGLFMISVSFFIMSNWPVSPNYSLVIGSMLVMMAGMAWTMTPATNMLMSSIPRNRSGMGSAMNDTTRELGGTLGVAILGTVLSSTYSHKIAAAVIGLPDQVKTLAEKSLAGAIVAANNLGPAGDTLVIAAKKAWMHGLSDATICACAITITASVIAAIWLPHKHIEHADDEIVQPVIEE